MNEKVFRRVEQKYLITPEQKNKLLSKIKKEIEHDEFFESRIMNIYFDNLDNDILITSLDKPVFKEKVRLRSYDIPDMNTKVFFEIKAKNKGIVGKRRIKLSLKDYYNYIDNNILIDEQIMKEIDYYYKLYDLKPFMFVGYDRKSYKGKNTDRYLRITIDENLRYRFDNLRLENGDEGDKFFDDDLFIMEIKTLDAMPLWLVRSLSELKIYPTSFSKVGSIYSKNKRSA